VTSSPLAQPAPWNLVASAYAAEVVPQFEHFAKAALDLARISSGSSKIVDVACGPGTLSFLAAKAGHEVSALDFSDNMIRALKAHPDAAKIDARVGDGMALPYDDATFDAAFSMFGLMFFPNREKGFRELLRVLKVGGYAVNSSWVSFERFPLIAATFGALNEIVPPPPNTPPFKPPLATRDECIAEMSTAGFRDVEVHEVVYEQTVASTTEFWAMLQRTNAPIVLRKESLGVEWPKIAKGIHERLLAKFGDGPQQIAMPAHLAVGRR